MAAYEELWSPEPTTTYTQSAHSGAKITMKAERLLTKVTKVSTCTATKCYLYAANGSTLLDTQTFSGNDATFNYSLSNSTDYIVLIGKDGASHTATYNSNSTWPDVGTNLNFKSGWDLSAGLQNQRWNIHSITTSDPQVNITITPSTLTLSTTEAEPIYLIQVQCLILSNSLNLGNVSVKIRGISYTKGEAGVNKNYLANDYRIMNLIPEKGSDVPMKERVLI